MAYNSTKNGIKEYSIDEELLLCEMLGVERVDLYTQDLVLSGLQAVQFEDALKKRAKGEPLQHLTGKADFFGLKFFVEPGVFIPRPETEVLVDAVIRHCEESRHRRDDEAISLLKYEIASPRNFGARNDGLSILDLCTGSGCIAISLAKYAKCGNIIATDISSKSIEIAQKNAVLNGVADKIEFKQTDLFKDIDGRFDIIICNPPYIKRTDLKTLPAEVSYDPAIALDGGEDGLDFYRKITIHAPKFLKENGILAMELGDNQAEAVKGMLSGKTKIIRDLNGIERVLIWTK